jgi:hypothetical protein
VSCASERRESRAKEPGSGDDDMLYLRVATRLVLRLRIVALTLPLSCLAVSDIFDSDLPISFASNFAS